MVKIKMNKEEIIKFCEKFLPAWTGNQPEELIKFYDKNAFYLDPAKPDGLKGHKQILPYFKKLLALNPDWVWEAVEIFPSSEHCFTAKWKATIPVGPEVVIENGIDIIEVVGGKITRNEVYFDRSKLLSIISKLKK